MSENIVLLFGEVNYELGTIAGNQFRANHTFFPNNPAMWTHALSFLKTGHFPAP